MAHNSFRDKTKSTGATAMTIAVNTPTATGNTPFTVSGTLTGYTTKPTLTYIDNPVVPAASNLHSTAASGGSITLAWNAATPPTWKSLPTGATVSTTAFSFTHPAMAAGSYVTDVSDGTLAGKTTYTVGTVTPPTVTHTTVIAKLNQLQTEITGIIADVGKLTP